MTPFHVGMRVVCVADIPRLPFDCLVVKGDVFEISTIEDDCYLKSKIGLCFVERPLDAVYCSSCFRPAHENRMDELRTLLAPVPSKELVQS